MSDEPSPPLRLKPRTPAPTPPAGAPEESAAPTAGEPAPRPARPTLRIVERSGEPAPATSDAAAGEAAAAARVPEQDAANPDGTAGADPTTAEHAALPPEPVAGVDSGRVTVSADADPSAGGPPVLHIGLKGDAEPEVPLQPPPFRTPEVGGVEPPPLPFAAGVPLAPDLRADAAFTEPAASAPQRRRAFKIGVYAAVLLTLALVGAGATFFFRAVKRATDAKRNQVRATPVPAPVATPVPSTEPSAVKGALSGAIAKAAVEVKKAEVRAETVETLVAPPPPPRAEPQEDLSRFPPPTGRPVSAEAGASRAFVAFVESARISGVFEGNPARALINGRTVRAGTVVDAPLGVVFVGLDAANRQVIFRDATGVFIRKPY